LEPKKEKKKTPKLVDAFERYRTGKVVEAQGLGMEHQTAYGCIFSDDLLGKYYSNEDEN
jgi:hypothetical protein